MNSFKLSFEIPESIAKIAHGQQILFLGSCFSDEISNKAKYAGLNVASNPFGTVFHPLALSRFLKETCAIESVPERIIQRSDLFFSWDANSSIYGTSETALLDQLKSIRQDWSQKLKKADFIFITFGTAWVYFLNETNELVANCHKFPSTNFFKKISEQGILLKEWKETIEMLKEINPSLKIIFTVSPVRHIKDGLVENNRSKGILLDLVRRLEEECGSFYFPSYEIVIDELRDYRFFKMDRVHPNEEAIKYVWDRFADVYFSNQTKELNREVVKLRLAESHRSLFPESEENKQHLLQTKEKRTQLLKDYPMINLD